MAAPGLAGVNFRFSSSGAFEISEIAAGAIPEVDPSRFVATMRDVDGGETYTWSIARQELPPGTISGRVRSCGVVGGRIAIPGRLGADGEPVLLGYELRYDAPTNRSIHQLRVELVAERRILVDGLSRADGRLFIDHSLLNRDAGERYCVTVTYGLVPHDWVTARRVIRGTSALPVIEALPAVRPVLQGFNLEFEPGINLRMKSVQVSLQPGIAAVNFSDQHQMDPFDYTVSWVDLR